MAPFDPKIPDRSAVRSHVVGDELLRSEGILLQELAHHFQHGVLISLGLDQHIEDFASGVDGPAGFLASCVLARPTPVSNPG
jgi:hypothetical protein